MGVNESKLIVVSEYVDLSSAKIKESFRESEKAVDRFSEAVDRMSANLDRTINTSADRTVEALKAMKKSFDDNKKPIEENMNMVTRLTQSYTKMFLELARIRNAVLLTTFAFRPLINFVKDSVSSFSEAEDALNRLDNALINQGTYTATASKNLVELSTAFERTSRFGDDMIQNVFQRLISVGDVLPSQLERVTQATLNYAAASGRDLPTAANVVSKAMAGFTGELSRYGIFIDKSIPKTQKAEQVLQALEKRFSGLAQKDLGTYSGRIAQMANNFDNLKEAIGRIIVEKTNLDKIIESLSKMAQKAIPVDTSESTENIKRLNAELKNVDKQISNMSKFSLMKLFDFGSIDASIKNVNQEFKLLDLKKQRENIKSQIEAQLRSEPIVAEAEIGIKAIDSKIGTEGMIGKISDFSEKFTALQNDNKALLYKTVSEEYAAYKDLANRRLEIEKGFAQQRAILEKARTQVMTQEARKQIDNDLESLKIREQSYIDFLSKADKIDAMRTEEQVKIYGRQVDVVQDFTTAATRAMDDGFFDIITGRFEDLGDVVRSFGETMLKTFIQLATNKLFFSIFGGPLGFAASSAALSPGSFYSAHRGGYVRYGMSTSHGYSAQDRSMPYAGRYHSGGEVKAILKSGEGVVNQEGMRNLGVNNLNKLNSGMGLDNGSVINNYYIQTIDERSFRERLGQNGDLFVNATARGIRDNQSIRRTIQRFGT